MIVQLQDNMDSASASLVNAQGCGTFSINVDGDDIVGLNVVYQAPTKMALGANNVMKGQWGLVRGQ